MYHDPDFTVRPQRSATPKDVLGAIDCRVERVVEHQSRALVFGRVEAVFLRRNRLALLSAGGRQGFCGELSLPPEIL